MRNVRPRSRTPKKFNKVTGADLIKDFTQYGPDPLEKTIEQVLVSQTAYASSNCIRTMALEY